MTAHRQTAAHLKIPGKSAYHSNKEFVLSSFPPLSVSSHLKEEGVGVVSQLAQQFGLYPGVDSLLAVLQRWVHLTGRQVQLPAEGDSHHIHVVSAVPEGAGQSDED